MSIKLVLYTRPFCGFCTRVKHFIANAGIDLPEKNTWEDQVAGEELIKDGGSSTVPCLRIENENGEVNWLYESTDIITYLSRSP